MFGRGSLKYLPVYLPKQRTTIRHVFGFVVVVVAVIIVVVAVVVHEVEMIARIT